MNHKIRAGGFTLAALHAVLFSGRLHVIISLLIYMVGDLKYVFGADAYADLTALAELLVNIYCHDPFLSFCAGRPAARTFFHSNVR